MADRHIADKECQFIAVNGPPDFCKVGNAVVPFDITDTLDRARDPSGNVYARGANVLKVGTRVNTVDGDAGAGVASGCSKGHTIVLSGSESVFVNNKPVAYHGSKVGMNCNGGDTPNTSGELRTKVMPPKSKWGSKEAGKELKDKVKKNREALRNNPMGKSEAEAAALRDNVRQTINEASQHEKAAFDAVRNGNSNIDVLTEAMQTRQDAYNLLGEAERQVLYSNPTSQAVVSGALGFAPGSGLVDAATDAKAAYEAAGQGNYMSAAGSGGMAIVGAVSELPGLKQVKGVIKLGKAGEKINDAKKLAELRKAEEAKKLADAKKAEEAEKARQNGTVVEKKKAVKAKPKCGQSGPYKKNRDSHDNEGMNWDHVPSQAALLGAAEKAMGRGLSAAEISAIVNNAPTIAVPTTAHQKESETFGGRQHQTVEDQKRPVRDSDDLQRAAKENTDKMHKKIGKYDRGCAGAYKKAADEITARTHDEWVKWIKNTIKEAK
jgi:uncharacterized Zn-binding protein involved in type VI secretion